VSGTVCGHVVLHACSVGFRQQIVLLVSSQCCLLVQHLVSPFICVNKQNSKAQQKSACDSSMRPRFADRVAYAREVHIMSISTHTSATKSHTNHTK